jgi:hypothetical protein
MVSEILDLLGHGHARNRQSDGFGSGLVANLYEKVLADMNKAGELGKFNTTGECIWDGCLCKHLVHALSATRH